MGNGCEWFLVRTDSRIGSYASLAGRRILANRLHRVGGGITPAVLPHHTDVPFGIRRFMKPTGSVDGCPTTKPAPCGRTRIWERLGSYACSRRSTTGLARW